MGLVGEGHRLETLQENLSITWSALPQVTVVVCKQHQHRMFRSKGLDLGLDYVPGLLPCLCSEHNKSFLNDCWKE